MTLIKNNIKLLLRCKALILIVLVMVLVTGLLSAVFKDLMTDSFEIKECNVGYTFSSDCKYEPMKPVFEKVFEDNDIDLIYYPQVDAEKLVENGSADVFIEIDDEGCTVYSSKEYKNEAGVIKIIAYSIISQSAGVQVGSYLNEYEIKADPMPDSELYYTIAYTVYFIWCAMIVLGIVLSSERKNRIGLRYRCSPASSIKQYFGYFVPTSIVIILLIGVSVAICTPLFSISWIGIPFAAYLLFIGTVGIIFNLFCVLMGIFGKKCSHRCLYCIRRLGFHKSSCKGVFQFRHNPRLVGKSVTFNPSALGYDMLGDDNVKSGRSICVLPFKPSRCDFCRG